MSNCCSNTQNQNADNRLKTIGIIAAVLIVGGIAFGVMSGGESSASGTPKISVSEKRFDFGKISMSEGFANHEFEIKNDGDADLVLSNIKTSCICTTAILKVDGKESPKFGMHKNPVGWSEKIKPGQTATLAVVYDPNAHGPNATGPITRKITMITNDKSTNNGGFAFTIMGEVIK